MPVLIPSVTAFELVPVGTAVGAPSTGTTFAAPAKACIISWQVFFGTAPGSTTIELQASNDGVTFTPIDNTTTLVTGSMRITQSSARFLRAVMTAVAGGTTWGCIISAAPLQENNSIYAGGEVYIGGTTVRTGLSGSTTAVETLFSMGINARSFITTNRAVKIVAFGTTGANAANKQIFVATVANATDLYTFLNGAVNNLDWTLEYLIMRRGFGSFIRRGFGNVSSVTPAVAVAAASLDETVSWTFQVRASTGTATTDNVVLHGVVVTTIPGIPNII